MNTELSVIILTRDEELHIDRCIKSVLPFASEVFVVDSFSSDRTVEIAESLGAIVYRNEWINYATQLNWSLDNLPINTEWVMRMDADEFVTEGLQKRITEELETMNGSVSGIFVRRRVYFMGRWIRHGGYYPTWLLRIWRNGKGYCEKRWMDEHIKITEGSTVSIEEDIVDDNRKGLHWWIEKHNGYATREAIDMLNLKYKFLQYDDIPASLSGTQEQRKRWLKENVYARAPLFVRPFVYFIYRYFLRLGFLDGREGLVFHFLQGFWYRFLVDARIYEIKKKARRENRDLKDIIKQEYGIN
jgi:glycosyltransferase involved in cell wall biosynthesis